MSVLKRKINNKVLGDLLYKNGMSVKELQEKSKVSICTLSQALGKGRAVLPRTAKKIADVFGVDVLSILEEEPAEKGA